jgi:hypothetical protein
LDALDIFVIDIDRSADRVSQRLSVQRPEPQLFLYIGDDPPRQLFHTIDPNTVRTVTTEKLFEDPPLAIAKQQFVTGN